MRNNSRNTNYQDSNDPLRATANATPRVRQKKNAMLEQHDARCNIPTFGTGGAENEIMKSVNDASSTIDNVLEQIHSLYLHNNEAKNNNCNTTTTTKENAREEMNGSNNVSEHSNDNNHTVIIPFLEDAVRNASTSKVNNIILKNTNNYCSSLNFIRKDYQ